MLTVTPLRTGYRFGASDLPPEFAHPPLIEAWLGVEFDSAVDLSSISAAAWRQRLGPEWLAEWQSIGPVERHAPGTTQIELQMQNVMSDRAIRFSSKGFAFGWLGHEGNIYPRYEAIRDGFVATLDAVRDVVPQVGTPLRWSVCYVNRVPQGTVWSTANDWLFFRLWQPAPLQKLKIAPEGFAGRWQFPLEAERGTLVIEFSHEPSATSRHDVEQLWLRLTTSGPTEAGESSFFDGLDYGREVIVRSFNDLVSSDAKLYWGAAPRKGN